MLMHCMCTSTVISNSACWYRDSTHNSDRGGWSNQNKKSTNSSRDLHNRPRIVKKFGVNQKCVKMKKSSSKDSTEFLSSVAADYYKRHGKSRGIEKFFRGVDKDNLKVRASSDSSLQSFQDDEDVKPRTAKSMENLQGESAESSSSAEVVAVVDEAIQTLQTPVIETTKPPAPQEVNVSVESKVDVNLPPAQPKEGPNIYPTYIFPPAPQLAPRILYCIETQTPAQSESLCCIETQTSEQKATMETQTDVTEDPIEPVITPVPSNKPAKDDISPNSSIASKDQRLEWDSMADIGYSTEDLFRVCGPSELKATEKRSLLKYFEQKGLKLDSNVVVVKNTSKDLADDTPKRTETDKVKCRERWQQIYAKYKDKYHESASQTTLDFDQPPGAKSTPKAIERSAQTSVVDVRSTSCQANNSTSGQSSVNRSSSCSEKFIFVRGSPGKKAAVKESTVGSVSTASSVHEVEGSFEEELRMAIALMNSVLESKSMHTKLKKSLVSKIMQKIVNLKINNTTVVDETQSRSEKTRSSHKEVSKKSSSISKEKSKELSVKSKEISEKSKEPSKKSNEPHLPPPPESSQNTLSSGKSMICYDEVAETPIPEAPAHSSASDKIQSLLKESLQPMTHSEIDYNHSKKSSSAEDSSSVVQYVKKEKLVQLAWIEKEIEHLKDLRKLLTAKREASQSSWGSHANPKSTRSRLQTPTSEESLVHSMERRKEEFVKNYETLKRKKTPLYTKPESLYHSAPKSSTDDFSSGSISIPIVTMTNTTTHQYDLKPEAAVIPTQTTDSILRTNPINERRTDKTLMVRTMKADKQQQTNPQALAYVLTFTGTETVETKEEIEEDFDPRTLKEHLNEKRPKVWGRMDGRNQCIRELRRLRALRNEARTKLLLLTSDATLKERLQNLPPPPLAQKRLFSTKALRLHTLKQCQNLPEVQRKKEIEKINNLKKKNRLITGMFNKNLQRKALRGQTDLSNSVHLFSN